MWREWLGFWWGGAGGRGSEYDGRTMRTFFVETLGCKVNQYEGAQIGTMLKARGLTPVPRASEADLRIVHTCSVTREAAAKSRQTIRRTVRAEEASEGTRAGEAMRRVRMGGASEKIQAGGTGRVVGGSATPFAVPVRGAGGGIALPVIGGPEQGIDRDSPARRGGMSLGVSGSATPFAVPARGAGGGIALAVIGGSERAIDREETAGRSGMRTIVTGCFATSDAAEVRRIPGVDAVLTHQDDVAGELHALLDEWMGDRGAMPTECSRGIGAGCSETGMRGLPALEAHDSTHQRAFLKIQDGCDAHCTYCIIPRLRGGVWSKPIERAVDEARRLVGAGHVEIILTGIFLGAYGQTTARRDRRGPAAHHPLSGLVESLCREVPGLARLRLSSLEPGDLDDELLSTLASQEQVVPHFHLPLQSGSDRILARMNRQYRRGHYVEMIERVRRTWDRPAITTDVIVGFPGETDADFAATMEVVDAAKIIHVHAFGFSPREKTPAARWARDVPSPRIVAERIAALTDRAAVLSAEFRRGFVGETVGVIVERSAPRSAGEPWQHGRSERYFDVKFAAGGVLPGQILRVRVDQIVARDTYGTVVSDPPGRLFFIPVRKTKPCRGQASLMDSRPFM